MRYSLDANILFYAFETGTEQSRSANRILASSLTADCVLTNRAIGEFLNAVRRKRPDRVDDSRQVAESWSLVFPVAGTSTGQLIRASALAQRHRLQFWDSVILVVAGEAGAEFLLSEDMQDGALINGVRLLDPFLQSNAEAVNLLLTPSP